MFDVSADGSLLVYRATNEEGLFQLYIRRLDQPTPRPLPGTQGAWSAMCPVFSPDAQWIAYYDNDDQALKKIWIHGGPPTTLCNAAWIHGMTWSTDGYIVYCRGGARLHRVGENGGEPETLVFDDEAVRFDAHSPHVLPDASAVLVSGETGAEATEESSIKAYSFVTGQTTDIVSNGVFPLYSQSGHLLFLRDSTLMAAPFDAERLELTGPAVPFVESVSRLRNYAAHVRITRAGTLFFLSGDASGGQRTLVALDREGVPTPLTERPGQIDDPALSADGTRIAVAVEDEASGTQRVWMFDIEKDRLSLLTPEPGQQRWPAWSPDGEWVYYMATDEEGNSSVFRRRADRGGGGRANSFVNSLKGQGNDVHVIGDSNEVGYLEGAMLSGARLGHTL